MVGHLGYDISNLELRHPHPRPGWIDTVDDQSDELFGRYQALRIYASIARLTKTEFTTGEMAALTSIPSPQLSKELGRLTRLGLVRPTSRRGNYERLDDTPFWHLVDALAHDWGY
jgi:hypothetical protein